MGTSASEWIYSVLKIIIKNLFSNEKLKGIWNKEQCLHFYHIFIVF